MDSRDELILKLVDRLAAIQSKPSVESEVEAIKALGLRVDELTTERNILARELDAVKNAPAPTPKPTPKRDALLAKLRLIANEKKGYITEPATYTVIYADLLANNINLKEVLDYIAEEDAQ